MSTDTDKMENARAQGQAQFNSICEMVAAVNCDFDRLQELRDMQGAESLTEDEAEELAALKDAAGDCESEDEARERIQENALSVEVRGDWYSPISHDLNDLAPTHFRILLCTGGPAVQIVGELGEHGEPSRAWMQVQDWFTPWRDFFPEGEDVGATLLAYASCFYFGE